MARLYISEQGRDSVYEIFDEEITIGRGAANAVQIADSHASKHHASVRQVLGRWKLVDLESKNGTRVNGQFLNQRWLEHGDTITIGTAVLRFEGVAGASAPAPAPAAFARPAAPAPRAAPPVPVPVAAPAVARPVPVAAAAPASRPVAAPASRPASAVRRRPREEMEVDEETGRAYRRKGVGSGPILLVGIPAAVLLVLIFFWLGGGDSLSTNQRVERDAQVLADAGDIAGALALAEAQADPGGAHWERLEQAMENWRRTIQSAPRVAQESEAQEALKQIQKATATSEFRPLNARPEPEVANMLREFLTKYAGTTAAGQVMHSEFEPYLTFQRILRENATGGASPSALLEEVGRQARMDADNRRFGDAIAKYQRLIDQQRISLGAEAFQELKRKADEKITELEKEARTSFDAAMAEVKKMAAAGDTSGAKAKLAVMIDIYGVPTLVREAQAYRESLK